MIASSTSLLQRWRTVARFRSDETIGWFEKEAAKRSTCSFDPVATRMFTDEMQWPVSVDCATICIHPLAPTLFKTTLQKGNWCDLISYKIPSSSVCLESKLYNTYDKEIAIRYIRIEIYSFLRHPSMRCKIPTVHGRVKEYLDAKRQYFLQLTNYK